MTSAPHDWSSLSHINPEFKQLLSTLPDPNFQLVTESTTISSLRALSASQPASEKWPGVLEKDFLVPMRDEHENRIRTYSPQDRTAKGPLLVMIHGGGFCVGSLEQQEDMCRKWVKSYAGVAASIGHRLAPEVQFPVPLEDCYDALKWIASHVDLLEADPLQGFVLGGLSSGATAVMMASHLYRDEGLLPLLTGLYLSMPSPCVPGALPEPYTSDKRLISWEQNASAPIFNAAAVKLFADNFPSPSTSPLRSPFLWPTGHENLPPTYVQIAGQDLSRDYALLYEEVLRHRGVKTRLDVFPGLPHAFWSFFPEAEFSKDFFRKTERGIEWLLENSMNGGQSIT